MDWKTIIYQFSMRLTGNRWDAEDLTQEAWLKAMKAIEQKPDRTITKAYLYRIVKNAWLDANRKQRLRLAPVEVNGETGDYDPALNTRELLEQLAESLPAKMGVILLLMDVLQFTAKETAVFVQMKEAAVQVALGRARRRLKQAAQQSSSDKYRVTASKEEHYPVDFDGLVEAFRRRDPQAIFDSYIGLAKGGFRLAGLNTNGRRMQFTFKDPDGNLFGVVSENLIQ